jgi:putative endonuclease
LRPYGWPQPPHLEAQGKGLQGLTATYDVTPLVWCEVHNERSGAFRRERKIKKWNRAWKIRLIEELNPQWLDLYESLNQ